MRWTSLQLGARKGKNLVWGFPVLESLHQLILPKKEDEEEKEAGTAKILCAKNPSFFMRRMMVTPLTIDQILSNSGRNTFYEHVQY